MSIHLTTLSANVALVPKSSALLAVVILGGLIGLMFGSFLNVVIYRVPARISLSYPPSHCPQCKNPISPLENIPVLSWLALRGKCRHCKQPIPLRYPATELATGSAFALAGAIRVEYLSQLRDTSEITALTLALFAQWTAIAAVIALAGLAIQNHVPRTRSLLEISLAQLVLLGGAAIATTSATSTHRQGALTMRDSHWLGLLAAVAMTAILGAAWIATSKSPNATRITIIDRAESVLRPEGMQGLLAVLLAGSLGASWSSPASLALWALCALVACGLEAGHHPVGKEARSPRPTHRLSVLIASLGMLTALVWSGVGAGALAKWP